MWPGMEVEQGEWDGIMGGRGREDQAFSVARARFYIWVYKYFHSCEYEVE